MGALLAEHPIHTDTDPRNDLETLQNNIATLEGERQGFRDQLRREKDPERTTVLKEQAKAVSKELFPLRQYLKTAKQIEDRLPDVQKALEAEKQSEIEAMERHPRQFQERTYER